MKRILTILPILSLALAGCFREPLADAIITPNPAFVGEDIDFTNISSHTDYVEWDMDDGSTSSAFNVTHYYNDPGFYDVELRAFGTKGGVNVTSFLVEVIGSELKVVVQLWTPDGEPQGYYLEGASVRLYPTVDDWERETNMVAEQFTNGAGECNFSDLSYQRYYVDVWDQNHDNYTLAAEDVGWIETDPLHGASFWTFYAFVDYYPPGTKKSANSISRKQMLKEAGTPDEKRPLKINKMSKPKTR